MKTTFIGLCLSLCLISFLLYSGSTLDWVRKVALINDNAPSLSGGKLLANESSVNTPSTTPTTVRPAVTKPLLPPSENRRFAIFACSIHASVLAYTFYTPITAASWTRAGYESIVVFVGDFSKPGVLSPRLNLSRNYLKRVGAHIVDLQCNESYSVKLSQMVRLFAGFLPDSIVQDEDNILTGDSDLMPLKVGEYRPTAGTNGFIFNAFCCGTFQRRGKSYTMFPSTFAVWLHRSVP